MAAGRQDRGVAAGAVQLRDVAAHAPGDVGRVELDLDGHAAGDQVKTAGEPEDRGELGRADGRLRDRHLRELLLHLSGQCHGGRPFRSS